MSIEDCPLVSCVMPTYNRRAFIPHAIRYFLRQDYANKELIIIDDGPDAVQDIVPRAPGICYIRLEQKMSLGAKLNMACAYAKGSIIVNWDDDDWYADWRLHYQVSSLQQKKARVCGINKLLYLDLGDKKSFLYEYPANQRTWLLGSSLCYTRELWIINKFADIDIGMDGIFVWNTPDSDVAVLDNHSFSVHMIHDSNISPKKTNGPWWQTFSSEELQQLMGADWVLYAATERPLPQAILKSASTSGVLKNVYACLVHENIECIKDLVLNLHYQDQTSTILLYNGSDNPELLNSFFPFHQYGTVIHPGPKPARYGYLHQFALDSLQFALDELDMDCMTIVDSDQLAVKKNYPAYLSRFVSAGTSVGMLSSNPERVDRNHSSNRVALQAFREYDLWKPLLDEFANGEQSFVHWTFWPCSVFMADAARDLLKLFKNNRRLQHIMQNTRIWASEEVILPTLVKLLEYEIAPNPCSYNFVRYKIPILPDELPGILKDPAAFWVHPVERNIDDPVRSGLRTGFSHYLQADTSAKIKQAPCISESLSTNILNKIAGIEGWLNPPEAVLLMEATEKICSALAPPHTIVEVGNYHGKATVLMGMVINSNFPQAKIVAIDPHDGKLGAADQGLQSFPPSLNACKKNIEDAGLANCVEIVQGHTHDITWNKPVSFLLIDGLHDYINVSRDFGHFAGWLRPGSFIAFHDYADYYPGVKVFVNELLAAGNYRKIAAANSLIVLQAV